MSNNPDPAAGRDLVLASITASGVGVLTLNNPERMNAWSAAMSKRFFERLAEFRADPSVKVVVITGAGKGFCPGADMDALNQIRANPAGKRARPRALVDSAIFCRIPSRSSPP